MRCQEKGKNPFDIASEKTDVTVRQISADQWNTQAFLAYFRGKVYLFLRTDQTLQTGNIRHKRRMMPFVTTQPNEKHSFLRIETETVPLRFIS